MLNSFNEYVCGMINLDNPSWTEKEWAQNEFLRQFNI